MDYEEAYNIRSINLEPRLQEYIRRKRFNQENSIDPDIPEEKEFCITKQDMKIIRDYEKGRGVKYGQDMVKPSKNTFEENDFKKDPRYERLKKKMQSHKDAQKQIKNLEYIDEDYTIFHQSNPYDSRPDKRPSQVSKPYLSKLHQDNENYQGEDNYQDYRFMTDSHENNNSKYCYSNNKKNTKKPHTYNHPPKISYNQYVMPQRVTGGLEHSRDVSDVIGKVNNYNRHLNNTYEYIINDKDTNDRTRNLRERENNYQSVPFMYGNGLPNVTLEESLKGGIRDTSKKSIGFRNSFEHSFSYISDDISNPDHTVNMWPQTTRGRNKEVARPKSGAVQSEKRLSKRQ